MVDRGQAHTLEAFSAAIVLLASVVFALQVTAVTPLTASTASQHIENQQSGVGGGLLDRAAESGALKRAVLYREDDTNVWHNDSGSAGYPYGGPPNDFGEMLNETFLDRGIAFNVWVFYHTDDGIASEQMVDLGTPSDNAVTVHRSVVIYDDDHLYKWKGVKNPDHTVSNNTQFYISEDSGEDSPVYSIVKVEVTIWRM